MTTTAMPDRGAEPAVRTEPADRPRVLVVGSGWRFTSGISYYTCRLANAFAGATQTRVLLMRGLVPRMLYPGRSRVGKPVNSLTYDREIDVFDGVDWFWFPSMLRARRFLDRARDDVLILQWWTGAVLHSYLLLAWMARRRGSRVVIEWHEVQDTGEARLPCVTRYVRTIMKALLRLVDGHLVHSVFDRDLLREAYGIPDARLVLAPHGPYDHHLEIAPEADVTVPEPRSDPDKENDFVFLYFGIIRPYKGVEDLVRAFELLPDEVAARAQLVIVGETWEGCTAPVDAVAASPRRDRITLVNRYVTDAEVARHFAAADAIVLPYRRSSASGPLHIAMSSGLPVVVTAVGGLVEAARDYEGTRFVPPADSAALAAAMAEVPSERGRRYADPHSWENTVSAYDALFPLLAARGRPRGRQLGLC